MGLLDGVKTVLGDLAAATERTIAEIGGQDIPMSFAKFYPGGLQGFLDRLTQDGHGAVVRSWLDGTDPQPISAAAVTGALPDPVAESMATDLFLSRERLPIALSEFLPASVASLGEDGRLKPQPTVASTPVVDKPPA